MDNGEWIMVNSRMNTLTNQIPIYEFTKIPIFKSTNLLIPI